MGKKADINGRQYLSTVFTGRFCPPPWALPIRKMIPLKQLQRGEAGQEQLNLNAGKRW